LEELGESHKLEGIACFGVKMRAASNEKATSVSPEMHNALKLYREADSPSAGFPPAPYAHKKPDLIPFRR
jgi:hypothetical protein